ncbi:hypothetical protein [[Eubacterium] cellulosolvens]
MAKSREKSYFSGKLKKAVRLLMYRRGRIPGAKEWELREKLGADYKKVIAQLNELLDDLGLKVKEIIEQSANDLNSGENTRFVVTLKDESSIDEAKMIGWRIDNLAGLAITISLIMSKQGKAPIEEVENILAEKFGKWKAMTLLETFTRNAYVIEEESGLLTLGWRAKAEVDLEKLMKIIAKV